MQMAKRGSRGKHGGQGTGAIVLAMGNVVFATRLHVLGSAKNGDDRLYSFVSYDQLQRAIGDLGNGNSSKKERLKR